MIKVTQKGDTEIDFDIDEALRVLDVITSEMVDNAKDKAPIAKEAYYEYSSKKGRKVKRRPGRLKKNIKRSERKKSFRVYVNTGPSGAPYAIYQEEGFTHWRSGKSYAGHHFMEGACEAAIAQMEIDAPEVAEKCLITKRSGGNPSTKIYG